MTEGNMEVLSIDEPRIHASQRDAAACKYSVLIAALDLAARQFQGPLAGGFRTEADRRNILALKRIYTEEMKREMGVRI